MTTFLDAGIRFIDFRIVYSKPPSSRLSDTDEVVEHMGGNESERTRDELDQEKKSDVNEQWYGLHMFQTNQPALSYLQDIRDWLIEHPTELVVLWLSRHGTNGATGDDQYPKTDDAVKVAFWDEIVSLFGAEMLLNTSTTPVNTTSLADLLGVETTTSKHGVTRQQTQVVIYAEDWKRFTGSSELAVDAKAHLTNQLLSSLGDGAGNVSPSMKMSFSARSKLSLGSSSIFCFIFAPVIVFPLSFHFPSYFLSHCISLRFAFHSFDHCIRLCRTFFVSLYTPSLLILSPLLDLFY